MTAACESECMPERRALVRYFYTINVFMYNDLGPSAGSRTETCPESKLTLYPRRRRPLPRHYVKSMYSTLPGSAVAAGTVSRYCDTKPGRGSQYTVYENRQ